jgi:hypothetical protein
MGGKTDAGYMLEEQEKADMARLRDAAALAALQGFAAGLASVKMTEKQADDAMEYVVRASWVAADAFIAARETKP